MKFAKCEICGSTRLLVDDAFAMCTALSVSVLFEHVEHVVVLAWLSVYVDDALLGGGVEAVSLNPTWG